MSALHVFTRDLRLHDNPGLMAAAPDAIPVFVADRDAERRHASPNRQAFLDECLVELDGDLRELGSSLVYRAGPWVDTVLDIAAIMTHENHTESCSGNMAPMVPCSHARTDRLVAGGGGALRRAAGPGTVHGGQGAGRPGAQDPLPAGGDVDGFLVGGASLDPGSFLAIVRAAASAAR